MLSRVRRSHRYRRPKSNHSAPSRATSVEPLPREPSPVERLALPDERGAVTRAVLNVERRRRSRDTSNRRSRDTPFATFVNRTADEPASRRRPFLACRTAKAAASCRITKGETSGAAGAAGELASSIPRMPYGQGGGFMQNHQGRNKRRSRCGRRTQGPPLRSRRNLATPLRPIEKRASMDPAENRPRGPGGREAQSADCRGVR